MITKLDIDMVHHHSWKPVWGQKIKDQGHKAGVGLDTLVGAGFFSFLLVWRQKGVWL